jgi:predicted nucleotidyltransferase
VLESPDVERISECLGARFGLDALWLFGSLATGMARSSSDVDLAALFRRRPSVSELLEARGEIGTLLARDVDLVDLERASPILAMQVLRQGRLLVDVNPARRQRFVAHAPGRYEDLKIVRREAERSLLARVRHGRP